MPPPSTSVTVTISAGQSVSTEADLTGKNLYAILVDPNWVAANMSFLISDDGTTFYDLLDDQGREALMPVQADSAIGVPATLGTAPMHMKVRSGGRDNPILQQVDVNIRLLAA